MQTNPLASVCDLFSHHYFIYLLLSFFIFNFFRLLSYFFLSFFFFFKFHSFAVRQTSLLELSILPEISFYSVTIVDMFQHVLFYSTRCSIVRVRDRCNKEFHMAVGAFGNSTRRARDKVTCTNSSVVSSGRWVGTFVKEFSLQSTMPSAHLQGCGHCGSALHSDPVRSTGPEHLNSCSCLHTESYFLVRGRDQSESVSKKLF